jgi:NitT/TauT family transport system substrate-binding protein
MRAPQGQGWTRRRFLGGLALAGTTGLLGLRPPRVAAEPPPETTRLRLFKIPGICLAPQYVAEELLRAEGFTDVQYLRFPEGGAGVTGRLGSGAIDMTQWYGASFVEEVDKAAPVVFLAGVHVGCQELFATDRVRTIADLGGKTIGIPWGTPQTWVIIAMLRYIGLDHRTDVRFVEHAPGESVQLLAEGKIDAFMASPPVNQELRARQIGHVLVNMTTDRPWSQYFCCMLVANKAFVRQHPAATKRAVRAILKADQVCALEPERVARVLVERGFIQRYDYALQTMQDVPYGQWRQYDPEDTVRFYALRLHEAGVIKSSPQKIIAQGTDWRFLNELKRELKG